MKIGAVVSYDGGCFSGWQSQKNAPTVQDKLQDVLSRLEKRSVTVRGSGRTDAGVHARGQVCAFDAGDRIPLSRLKLAINSGLPQEIRILKLFQVAEDFDPRRDAIWREYVYFIWNGSEVYPHLRSYVWWNKFKWSDERVIEGCKYLEGNHDFSAFCKTSECPVNSFRTLYKVSFRRKAGLGILRVRGNAFLMNMVRTIVGTLDIIGRQQEEPQWIDEVLLSRDRKKAGITAPACGLFLWKVSYPDFVS